MPVANVRGVALNYEIVGDQGPWVALCPGGRRAMEGVDEIAGKIAGHGYRVLKHDRRNTGKSDVIIDAVASEYEHWADDLDGLLKQLSIAPAYIGGSSSGARMSLLMAIRHPDSVKGLLLWRVTGGGKAAVRLSQRYYGQYIPIAKAGGMKAICDTAEFRERIAERPENRDRLMKMDPQDFINAMTKWQQGFLAGADLPVIGTTVEQLKAIRAPIFVIPGTDWTHTLAVAQNLQKYAPDVELCKLITTEYDMDVGPHDEWHEKEDEQVRLFVDFMKRVEARH
jgi:pimeloyl-ACP methyl ester carboxylesterase